jgi:hypothetical protein
MTTFKRLEAALICYYYFESKTIHPKALRILLLILSVSRLLLAVRNVKQAYAGEGCYIQFSDVKKMITNRGIKHAYRIIFYTRKTQEYSQQLFCISSNSRLVC